MKEDENSDAIVAVRAIAHSGHKVQFAESESGSEDEDEESSSLAVSDKRGRRLSRDSGQNQNGVERKRGRRRLRTLSDTSFFSASSASSTSSDFSSSSCSVSGAPDGGYYGWTIVLASFLVNLIADGVTFSFGVLFVDLQREFAPNGGKAAVAGVVSLFHSVPLLSGPVASALTDRYGCRQVLHSRHWM